jgi:hypothetical protein
MRKRGRRWEERKEGIEGSGDDKDKTGACGGKGAHEERGREMGGNKIRA